MSDNLNDDHGFARRDNGTFVNVGAASFLGSEIDQRAAGVGVHDSFYSAQAKVEDYQRLQAQLRGAAGLPMAPISVPKWLWWALGVCVAAFVAWASVSVWLASMAQGVAARGQLLSRAAGSSLGPLVDLAGAWEGAVGRNKPAPALAGDPAELVRRLQAKRLNFIAGRGPSFLDDPEVSMLQGAALRCLSNNAVQCLQAVAGQATSLDDKAIAQALVLGVPWSADNAALPVLLSSAASFAEFELRKSQGPLRGDIDLDRTQATLLALCLRRTVYVQALTPAQCHATAQQAAAKYGAGQGSITAQRLDALSGWRWGVADFVYRTGLPGR